MQVALNVFFGLLIFFCADLGQKAATLFELFQGFRDQNEATHHRHASK
jgi:hypothetical protein